MKYTTYDIVFREVPNEITLAINISNCPFRCAGCHSPELQTDVGDFFNPDILAQLLENNCGITCVCFMGGDANLKELKELSIAVANWNRRQMETNKASESESIKVAWYSGREKLPEEMLPYFNYIKIGPYQKKKGPINLETSNQRLYRIRTEPDGNYIAEDITSLLQKKGI